MLCRRRYYAVGHHKAGLRPLCTDLYGPPAPQTVYHSNIASCSRSHCAPGAFLHFGALLPRCRDPPFSRFASPQNLKNGGQKMSYHNDPYRVDNLKIYLRRRLCRQDVPPDGSHRPSRQCGRPMVHRGLRGDLAGCAGWLPRTFERIHDRTR